MQRTKNIIISWGENERGILTSLPDETYRNFRYRVKWRGRYVAGFAEIHPLPELMKSNGSLRSGFSPPACGPEGQGTPFFISLEKGISFDLGFEQWISMVQNFGPATGSGSLLRGYKIPIRIEIFDENLDLKEAYLLAHCWVAEYRAVPSSDAGSYETVIEHLKMGFDTWEWDPHKHT